jgi:hypothetical protein
VSELSWHPNVAAMEIFERDVWPRLVKDVPDASMTVVDRNQPKWIRYFADNNRTFEVTGFVDDVRPYLGRTSVYVCPITSRWWYQDENHGCTAMGKRSWHTRLPANGLKW